MADLVLSRPTRQMPASALAGVFGLFAGLCAIFAGCATIFDWTNRAAEARWPVVAAVVDRGDVYTSSRAAKDGGGTATSLRYRVRYQVDGVEQAAALTSRRALSEVDAARLRAWAVSHRKGTTIEIQYDPSQQGRAAFASAEVSDVVDRTGTDVVLLLVAAIASAGLLTLAKHLRSKEATAPPGDGSSQDRGGIAMGILFGGMGVMAIGIALHDALKATAPLTADNFMAVPAGLMFVFAGALLALPAGSTRWRGVLGALVVTCFAITLDWIAFGPGERKFSGGIGMGFVTIGSNPGELFGRAMFGLFAIILDLCAIAMWAGQLRRLAGAGQN